MRAGPSTSHADTTREAYAWWWEAFTSWCAGKGLAPLPADSETVALWMTSLATVDLRDIVEPLKPRGFEEIVASRSIKSLEAPALEDEQLHTTERSLNAGIAALATR